MPKYNVQVGFYGLDEGKEFTVGDTVTLTVKRADEINDTLKAKGYDNALTREDDSDVRE